MRTRSLAIFAAGFVAGGITLGGVLAHARLISVNLDIGGVPPGSQGSLLCVTANGAVRAATGTFRPMSVNAAGGGISTGVVLNCGA